MKSFSQFYELVNNTFKSVDRCWITCAFRVETITLLPRVLKMGFWNKQEDNSLELEG